MGELQHPSRFAISYQGPASGPDYERWREGICRNFCQLDAGPAEQGRIDCRNDFVLLHSIALATPTGQSARFARTRALLQDGCDDFVLIAAADGPVRVTQGATVIDLAAGQMCLTEMNVVGTAALTSRGRFTTTRMPRRALLQVCPGAETKLSRPLRDNPALGAMVERYFGLCNEFAADLDPAGQRTAAEHLVDLVGLLLGTAAEQEVLAGRRGSAAARLTLMQAAVRENLGRSDLSIEAIARAHGLSPRQAQRLFAEAGTTFSEFVLAERLALARQLLADPASAARKVSDIAYAAGFGDLSYFNRTFRRRFEATPRELRAALWSTSRSNGTTPSSSPLPL